MENIKILFITVDVSGGGAERMLFNIIESLDSKIDKELLITTDQKPSVETPIKHISLGETHASKAILKIIRHVKKTEPDYIFTTSSSLGYIIVLAKFYMKYVLKKVPKIIIRCAVPPSEVYSKSLKSKILKHIIRLTYNKADLIISQTDFMKRDLINSYKLKEHKIQTIRNIINKSFLDQMGAVESPSEYSKDNFNIVAVGALYSVKGFDILIEAMQDIVVINPKVKLYILGEERYERGYKQFLEVLISKNNLENNVFLLGYKYNPYPYIKYSNLLVMSSRKEGFPNVVLEALHFMTPVLVTDCVDWKEIVVEGINGYIAKKDNVDSLKRFLTKAISTNFIPSRIKIENYDYNSLFT